MLIVKLTTPWKNPLLATQIDSHFTDFKFEIDNGCNVCDYWIVWGDLPKDTERMKVTCPSENIFYMTDEAHENKTFNQQFIDQFNYLITCRKDLKHKNHIHTHEINQWQLNKSFADVYHEDKFKKSKTLSVVCSDLTLLSGHKKRYAFVNKLIGHFKDRLDVYGRGFNPIQDKWDALYPYKYSIAIENSAINGYFTEKLTECYLAHTFPVYFGAPDVSDYFDERALLKIDLDDYKTSIDLIEKLLEEDPWEQLQETIIEQKLRYLDNYHIFRALRIIIQNLPNTRSNAQKNILRGAETYYSYYKLRKFWQAHKYKLYK